jgi:hypothetical protein
LLPADFALEQNYPNPFNPGTIIQFHLPHRAIITLKIFDVLGRELVTLVNGRMEAGSHSFTWEGATDTGVRLPSGVYFCRLATESLAMTKKLVLLK